MLAEHVQFKILNSTEKPKNNRLIRKNFNYVNYLDFFRYFSFKLGLKDLSKADKKNKL